VRRSTVALGGLESMRLVTKQSGLVTPCDRRFDSNGCQINDKCRRYSWAGKHLHAVGDSSALSLHQEQEVTCTFIGSTIPGTEATFTARYAAAFHK
jgi:hypothetical protein